MITKIWLSIKSCGDGSVSAVLMESEEQCKLDQEDLLYGESWAEDCYQSISIESEGPIKILDSITTIDEQIKEIEEELEADYIKNDSKTLEKYTTYLDRLKELKK